MRFLSRIIASDGCELNSSAWWDLEHYHVTWLRLAVSGLSIHCNWIYLPWHYVCVWLTICRYNNGGHVRSLYQLINECNDVRHFCTESFYSVGWCAVQEWEGTVCVCVFRNVCAPVRNALHFYQPGHLPFACWFARLGPLLLACSGKWDTTVRIDHLCLTAAYCIGFIL